MNLRLLVMVVLVGIGGMGWCGTNEDNRPVGAVAEKEKWEGANRRIAEAVRG